MYNIIPVFKEKNIYNNVGDLHQKLSLSMYGWLNSK